MAKRKKNGGRSKKIEKPPSKRSIKLQKIAADFDSDDDDYDDTHDISDFGDNSDTIFDLADLEDDENTSSSTAATSQFATDYHAPVMPKECIDALLQQGVFGDMMKDKKDRWRKKKSIAEAKRRKAGFYNDDEGDDNVDENHINTNISSDNGEISKMSNRPRLFVDGTLGGGGHSQALLEQLNPEDILIGCDQDSEAISTASARLSKYLGTSEYILEKNGQLTCGWEEGSRPMFIPVQSNFRNLVSVLSNIRHPTTGRLLLGKRLKNNASDKEVVEEELEFPNGVNGMLLDLGVSSHQIDTGERGFAFMKDGPLDMRMDSNSSTTTTSSLTAADICNEFDEATLISILKRYGDEPRAKRITSAIIESRPLYTTTDLVHAINSVTPTFARQKRAGLIATSARVFQALRIVVNEEDGALEEVLEKVAPWALSRSGSHHSSISNDTYDGNGPDGILAVLSYHSMEDKMAKRVIRDGSVDLVGRRGKGGSVFERDLFGNIIGNEDKEEGSHVPFEPLGKPQKATDEEVAVNSRARSATLRVGIRI
jgi:16S rRNA (cytosine1402-N4)-methyltransferase